MKEHGVPVSPLALLIRSSMGHGVGSPRCHFPVDDRICLEHGKDAAHTDLVRSLLKRESCRALMGCRGPTLSRENRRRGT